MILEEKAQFTTFVTFIGIDISKEKRLNLISQSESLFYYIRSLSFLVVNINTVKEVVSTLIACTSVCIGYLV